MTRQARSKASWLRGRLGFMTDSPWDGATELVLSPRAATIPLISAESPFFQEIDMPDANTFCWNELATKDAETCKAFYTGLFGWGTQNLEVPGTTYTIFTQGDKQIGGMLQM